MDLLRAHTSDKKTDTLFMQRCLELASLGRERVAPNPMVGCVIVHKGRIIGEGFHQEYGQAHAEVNAINAVRDKSLLTDATLYVNLEPCAHVGKTPPCCTLLIKHKIPRVVVGAVDVNPQVSGKGILQLEDAGVEVCVGVLEEACWELNIRFYRYQEEKRPYIILKWAQTLDGFIDIERGPEAPVQPTWISGEEERILVHKWRSEEKAIMAGSRTVIQDNPSLTVRHWHGDNPIRLVLDRQDQIPATANIFDQEAQTIVFGTKEGHQDSNRFVKVDVQNPLPCIMAYLYQHKIQSVFVEGGAALVNALVAADLWDEARIFTANKAFQGGVKAPIVSGSLLYTQQYKQSTLAVFRNPNRVYQKTGITG